ncbi:MAG: HNH endonuclease [Sutterella sp.]|jgi:hypothetical protein|nr:HNH endonuclease [Sutterella sp.]
MPLLHICAYPGCQAAIPVEEKFCAKHKEKGKSLAADREARRKRFKGTAAQRGYGSKWQRLRAQFLKSHPLCEECKRQGRLTKATDVDHIIPHHGDPKLMWDQSNWQALCHECHSRKTAKENGGFGNPV